MIKPEILRPIHQFSSLFKDFTIIKSKYHGRKGKENLRRSRHRRLSGRGALEPSAGGDVTVVGGGLLPAGGAAH